MSNGNDKSLVKDPYKDISFSRRGLFAALAVVAGLGAVPARSAMAKELCFWKDYDGANQMWAFKPYLDDGVGTFTFALGSLIGPKLVQTLNNNGHVNANSSWKNGTMETGSAVIWDIRKAAGRENSWWIDHEPSATNETDHTCYFLTSDADGQRLDTLGASANGAAVRVSSHACPGVWGGQKNAQFKLIEARCGGYVKNSKKTVKMTADTVRYIRWTEVVSDGVVGVRRK